MNVQFGLFHLFISMTSASTSNLSSELELYLSSVNRGADISDKCKPELGNVGRGIQGVNGLCCVGGSAGTGVSCILTMSAYGGVDWHLFPESSMTSVDMHCCGGLSITSYRSGDRLCGSRPWWLSW